MAELTPVKAIHEKCLDCCCYQRGEVQLCPSRTCVLWPYRNGKRPDPAAMKQWLKEFKDFKRKESQSFKKAKPYLKAAGGTDHPEADADPGRR